MFYTGNNILKDVAQEGSQTDAFKLYFSKDADAIRKEYAEALKEEKRNIKNAVKLFEKTIDDCMTIKEKCSSIGGYDDGALLKLLSVINPLLLLIADEEVEGKYNRSKGRFEIDSTTRYDDGYSLSAPNEVQAQVQRSFNMIIANSKKHINALSPYVRGQIDITTRSRYDGYKAHHKTTMI